MPRPKANPEQHTKAYHLYLGKKGPKAIYDALYDRYGDKAVSERTIATWVKEFKGLSSDTTDLDAPFQWHQIDKYGLPWEAGGYLLEILYHVAAFREREEEEQKRGHAPITFPTTPLLTVREAIWCWRVHLAAPEIGEIGEDVGQPFSDVLYLARKFAFREIAHLVLGDPLNMADLEAILIYKPWLSVEKHDAYHKAVDEGIVTPLPSAIDVRDKVVDVFFTPETGASFAKVMVYDDYPVACTELLESQQRWLWGEQIARVRDAQERGQELPLFGGPPIVPEFYLRKPPEVKHFNSIPDEEDDNGETQA